MLIKGEYFNIGANLYDHIKISSGYLAAILAELYEENDCDSVEEFLNCIKDENILIYIKKEGE